jgi:hypothetical protein
LDWTVLLIGKRILKEAAVAYFMVIILNTHRETKENNGELLSKCESFKVFTAVKIHVEVFWIVTQLLPSPSKMGAAWSSETDILPRHYMTP